LTFTVPKTFCGPYQLDAVVGQPLPRVGHQNAFYDGYLRTGIPTSDYRNMLIDSNVGEMQGQASNGVCREALPMFPDNVQKIDSSFDYVGYPTSQLTVDPKQCATASIADWGSDIGFFVNGAWMGNDVTKLVLKPNDVVMYRFNTSLAACYGQEISLALYRNPNGANGMDTALNQRLVVSNSTTVDNTTKSLTIKVPADWDGGWQLDVAFGAPIPVIGDIGRTYSGGSTNMLKTAAKGFIGQ
jgi:hypothetical protein